MQKITSCGLAALLLGVAVSAWAAPAPWYWWSSRHDGQRVCAQVMPSQGWRRAEGPFNNAQCQPQRRSLIQLQR
ncbi:MAG: hypothetical protein KBT18_15185 [Comamonas sp.]|nr:hypothetical protein [Candidatus Comamonas equi]